MIFLIGMPGVGKSYWAKKLSEKYNLTLIDTDKEVERRYGSIYQMFEKQGESFFREKESEVLDDIITTKGNAIIACGGGVPVYNDNLNKMLNAGCVVYLRINIDILYSRLLEDTHRPLFSGANTKRQLEEIYNSRKSFYERAHYIIREPITIKSFQKIIQKCTS